MLMHALFFKQSQEVKVCFLLLLFGKKQRMGVLVCKIFMDFNYFFLLNLKTFGWSSHLLFWKMRQSQELKTCKIRVAHLWIWYHSAFPCYVLVNFQVFYFDITWCYIEFKLYTLQSKRHWNLKFITQSGMSHR